MYPQVRHTATLDRRIVNEGSQRYLCVLSDNNNSPGLLATKTLSATDDTEVNFRLHFFTSSQINDSKMVMIVHKATGSCLSVNDNQLTLRPLNEGCADSNMSAAADPRRITTADCRFFYIHSSGPGQKSYVIRAANGADNKLYWSMSDSGMKLILKTFGGTKFTSEMRFSLRS